MLSDDERFANIEFFRSLCAQNVCTSVFALRIEDFFFASDALKNNFLALLCEILLRVDPISIQQKSGKVGITEKPVAPIVAAPSEAGNATAPHHHQPLLSKRSKKQLAKMEAAMLQEEQKLPKNGKIKFCYF